MRVGCGSSSQWVKRLKAVKSSEMVRVVEGKLELVTSFAKTNSVAKTNSAVWCSMLGDARRCSAMLGAARRCWDAGKTVLGGFLGVQR